MSSKDVSSKKGKKKTPEKSKQPTKLCAEQKQMLIEFARKNHDIITCKHSNTVTRESILGKWEEITVYLNLVKGGAVKKPLQWKKTWQDLRKQITKEQSEIKKVVRGTGGGPPPKIPLNLDEDEIARMFPLIPKDGDPAIEESAVEFDDTDNNEGGLTETDNDIHGDDSLAEIQDILVDVSDSAQEELEKYFDEFNDDKGNNSAEPKVILTTKDEAANGFEENENNNNSKLPRVILKSNVTAEEEKKESVVKIDVEKPKILMNENLKVANVPCGRGTMSTRRPKVVGGQNAIPREFPWLVSITRKGGHFCGGTVINSRFILTAAHCVCSETGTIPPRQLHVTLGEYNLREAEMPPSVAVAVRNIVIHPDHKCGKYVNDIAILELELPISWTNSVQPACLPTAQGEKGYKEFNGVNAVAAGWGWLGEDRSKYKRTDVLQKVSVNIVGNEVCREWYESQGKKTRVGPQQMCAGHEDGGRDACWADSGGPLMVGSHLDESTVVVGVVSSGVGCARPRLPGIYTRISEYIPWIIAQIV